MSTANEKFIERIKNFEIIYDKKNINYSNTKERERIWALLAQEFNCDGKDAKKKWVRLRDKYVRGRRNGPKINGNDENDSEFNLQMSFLDNHIKIRRKENAFSRENVTNETKEYDPFLEETEMEDVKSFYNEFCMEITAPNSSENVCQSESSFDMQLQTKPKRQKIDPIQENFIDTLKIFQEKMNTKTKEEKNDEDTYFIRLVETKMKKMSNVEKSRFQLEMLRKADEIIIKK